MSGQEVKKQPSGRDSSPSATKKMPASRRKGTKHYATGASNERRMRAELVRIPGVVLVIRAAGSKTPIPKDVLQTEWQGRGPKVDLTGDCSDKTGFYIQAKPRSGSIPYVELKALHILGSRTERSVYEAWYSGGCLRLRVIYRASGFGARLDEKFPDEAQ